MMKKMASSIEKINVDESVEKIKTFLLQFQSTLSAMLESEDGNASFLNDEWQHKAGGGGLTRVMEDGTQFEKAGVNFSHVHGAQLPAAATARRPELANTPFQALGVSSVVHPRNPYVPTAHLNVRFIALDCKDRPPIWWFGGGFDLTPYYGNKEDCIHWHQMAKAACEDVDPTFYPRYKKWADDYFYLQNRQEPRGIGGIFYDDLNDISFADGFRFMQRVAEHFLLAYQPIIQRRKLMPYGEREQQFQYYRRGRYVEFNLLYDRGTLFGLHSQGRTESILMSLPPHVSWKYNWQPAAGSPEEELYNYYLIPRDWANLS